MNAPDRPNRAVVSGTDRGAEIVVYNRKGSSAGWRWDSTTKTMVHMAPHLKPSLRFAPEVTAAFDTAAAEVMAAYRPGRHERLTGLQLSRLPEADRAGFEWDGNMDDDAGHYARYTPGVTESRDVHFGRQDIVETVLKAARR